jgi:ATP-dependent Zn protease
VEARRLLEAAHLRVQTTLTGKRSILEALAKLLIEKEVVDRNAFTTLLAAPRA